MNRRDTYNSSMNLNIMPVNCVVVTGTPGTGKTTVCNRLKEYGYNTMNLFDFAKENDCIEGMDEERDSLIVNEDKLVDVLYRYLDDQSGILIIDSHYGDLVPKEFVCRAFVLSAPIVELKKRLALRLYDTSKVDENVEAEIFQVCWTDALDAFGARKVVKIENNEIEETVYLIKSYIENLG